MNDELIYNATLFAYRAHEGQLRKFHNVPYIYHPARVALLATVHASEICHPFQSEISGAEFIAAAWLHDTVEDCGAFVEDLRQKFGDNVAKLVEELTKVYTKDNYPNLNRLERSRREHDRLKSCSKYAHMLKLMDRLDNLRDYPTIPDFYKDESRELLTKIGLCYNDQVSLSLSSQILELLR